MRTSPTVLWAGALVAALALTGCGTGSPAAQAPATPRPTTTTPAPTTTTTTTTTTTAPTTTAVTADDARHYSVCASRSCEVAVSKPVHIRVGGSVPGTLVITHVTSGSMHVDLELDAGGGGDGTLKPGCSTFVFGASGGGSGTFGSPAEDCADDLPDAQPGAVTLQLPAMTGGIGILRIVIA